MEESFIQENEMKSIPLQSFLSRHYGDNLDGCGLDLEGRVRKTYYTFLRRLLESVRSFTGDPDDGRSVSTLLTGPSLGGGGGGGGCDTP
jgi:hypothetical protein